MINVIGLGYIGLPTALSLCAAGLKVIGTDKNQSLVSKLNEKKLTFEEKGLAELFDKSLKSGIEFDTKPVAADIYIIAVPTPYNVKTKKINGIYVENAINDVIAVAPKGSIIAVESTIAPGTMDMLVRPIIEKKGLVCGIDIHIAHVPERIIPGNMIFELEHNSRTIGVESKEVGERLIEVYSSFCKGNMVITSLKVAEITKVVENTSRDINIAFANELAKICNEEKIDVYEVIKIANMHPRVSILTPGPGVGGHCIPVDPWFFVGDYPHITDIIAAARRVNDNQPGYILSRIHDIMKQNNIGSLSEVGFYGLTYKENVDDTRESPTLQLLERMEQNLAYGAKVYDPFVKYGLVKNQYNDFNEFIDGIKLVVIMVAHDHIKQSINKLSDKIVFDTRNCLNLESVIKL